MYGGVHHSVYWTTTRAVGRAKAKACTTGSWLPMVFDLMRIIAGSLLVVAGIAKLREGPSQLILQIRAFKMTRPRTEKPLAMVLPAVEILVGMAVVINMAGPWVLVASAIFAAYTAVISVAIARRLPTSCGCFGSLSKRRASPILVARNLFFIALLVPAIIGLGSSSLPWNAWAVATLGASLVILAAIIAKQSMSGLSDSLTA